MQKERSKSHLEQAKQASIERLMEELNDKDRRLRKLSEEQDRSTRLQSMTQEKVRKDVDFIKKQLSHERTLKLGAFHRVDELQSQVYELESNLFAHSPHGTASIPPTPAKSTRAVSASKVSRKIRPSTTSGVWPPPTAWPATRMQGAPEEGALAVAGLNNMDNRMVQRPKTVGGRLRSRIAEQLLNELEPDHHRIIVQLEQLQLEGRR
ncbi:hypothetical protein C0Q70_15747 [Pomacea canaliculata]|uniref:Uncharacterized protein n=1 Tax=Pomacea canaliculata TaxID=400727 RepID=A0A2T7NVQ4_POMCA|nr:coiled-coil domain-containing protein 162-like [Pomacea canaliculata]PVD25249.1 hypothetical protein C0Q70_15747 [Pomacea canaliculata]